MPETVLGVRIDTYTKDEALDIARSFFSDGKQHTIFTPNPEMLVDATNDDSFRNILNSGSLNICDGKGIELVSRGKVQRIPGVDFMLALCELAGREGKTVYLLGSGDMQVVQRTKKELELKSKHIKIVGIHSGPQIIKLSNYQIINSEENEKIIDDIIAKAPDILFVAFGHGKQERWIDTHVKELPSVEIAMGVGGAFDYISGKVKRAPGFMRSLGLEWLWRVIRQPWRVKRIWKATVVFLYLVIREKSYLFFKQRLKIRRLED